MDELIPLLIWGLLIWIFSSGSRKKRKDQQQRRVLVEERRRRMAEEAARAGGADVEWDAPGRTATLEAPPQRTPQPTAVERPELEPYRPPAPTPQRKEPQVPKDVWELIEVLARGGRPVEDEPPEPVSPPLPPPLPPAAAEERVALPEPAAPPVPALPSTLARAPKRVRRGQGWSIKQRKEARADAGLTAVDRVEHAEAADATLTDVDLAEHSRVESAMRRARERRSAGRRRPSAGILGMRGTEGLRRAVVAAEVLGRPAAVRRAGPHEPPE